MTKKKVAKVKPAVVKKTYKKRAKKPTQALPEIDPQAYVEIRKGATKLTPAHEALLLENEKLQRKLDFVQHCLCMCLDRVMED